MDFSSRPKAYLNIDESFLEENTWKHKFQGWKLHDSWPIHFLKQCFMNKNHQDDHRFWSTKNQSINQSVSHLSTPFWQSRKELWTFKTSEPKWIKPDCRRSGSMNHLQVLEFKQWDASWHIPLSWQGTLAFGSSLSSSSFRSGGFSVGPCGSEDNGTCTCKRTKRYEFLSSRDLHGKTNPQFTWHNFTGYLTLRWNISEPLWVSLSLVSLGRDGPSPHFLRSSQAFCTQNLNGQLEWQPLNVLDVYRFWNANTDIVDSRLNCKHGHSQSTATNHHESKFHGSRNMNTHLHNEVNPRMNHSQLELIWVYWCLFGNTSWLTGWFKNHQSWLVFLGWPQSKCWAASSLCSLSFCSCSSGPCAFEDGTCTCERQGRKQTLIKPIQRSILNPAKKT